MKPGNASVFSLGALGAAILSAVCCVGPLLLAVTGLGGGALFLKAAPFRPYLLGASAIFLAGAYYAAFRRRSPGECGTDCAAEGPSGKQRLLLGITTVIVGLAAADLVR